MPVWVLVAAAAAWPVSDLVAIAVGAVSGWALWSQLARLEQVYLGLDHGRTLTAGVSRSWLGPLVTD